MILALLVSTAQISDAAARTETANRPTPLVVVVPPATSTESTNYVLERRANFVNRRDSFFR